MYEKLSETGGKGPYHDRKVLGEQSNQEPKLSASKRVLDEGSWLSLDYFEFGGSVALLGSIPLSTGLIADQSYPIPLVYIGLQLFFSNRS